MNRVAALVLGFSVLATPAFAGPARSSPRPAQVFAEVLSAPLEHELAQLGAALTAYGTTAKLPNRDTAVTQLGTALNVPVPDGTDTTQPMAGVLVDPRGHQRPMVLVVEVANEHRFATATQNLPSGVAVKRRGRAAALGDPAVLALVGEYALGRLREAPKDGIRARVFVQPLWAAFGSSAPLMRGLLAAQTAPAQKGSTTTPANNVFSDLVPKLFDGLVSGAQQVNELMLDVHGGGEGLEVALHVIALPGSGVDGFIATQRASDFSALAEMVDVPTTYVAAGHLDLTSVPGFGDFLFGPPQDDAAKAMRAEWMRMASGEVAISNHIVSPTNVSVRYLLRTPEAAPSKDVIGKMLAAMASNSMFGNSAKLTHTPLPPTTYDGLTIENDRIVFDMSKIATKPEQAHVTSTRSWTLWGNTLANTLGDRAPDDMKALIDAARHGKQTWQPTPDQRRSLDQAKAAKESFWMSIDAKALQAMAKTQSPPKLDVGHPTVAFGFHGHDAWVRVRLSPSH